MYTLLYDTVNSIISLYYYYAAIKAKSRPEEKWNIEKTSQAKNSNIYAYMHTWSCTYLLLNSFVGCVHAVGQELHVTQLCICRK